MAAIGVVFGVATAALAVANGASIHTLEAANPTEIVMSMTFALVGGLIASQRSRNPVGWLFLFMSIVMGCLRRGRAIRPLRSDHAPGAAGRRMGSLVCSPGSERLVYPAGAATLALMLIPDGRLPSRRGDPSFRSQSLITIFIAVVLGALGASPLQGPDNLRNLPIQSAVRGLVALAQGPLGFLWFIAVCAPACGSCRAVCTLAAGEGRGTRAVEVDRLCRGDHRRWRRCRFRVRRG